MSEDMTVITVESMIERRDRFRRAENHKGPLELPLREKQAVIDTMLRGLPLASIAYRPVTGDDGQPFYLVIRGWAQLQAVFDFVDNKFPTWTAAEKKQWERSQK